MKPMFLNKLNIEAKDKFGWLGDERIEKGTEAFFSQYVLMKDGLKVMVNVYLDGEPKAFKQTVKADGEDAKVTKICPGFTYYKYQSVDTYVSKAVKTEEKPREVTVDFFEGKKCEFVYSGLIRAEKPEEKKENKKEEKKVDSKK